MQYHYVASQPNGEITEGDLEAPDISEVLRYLSQKKLKPISIKPVKKKGELVTFFKGKVTVSDQIFISKYLALMLRVGTGLLEAVNILVNDFRKQAVKDILIEVRSSLEQGRPFWSTFAKYPKIFDSVYINLVKVGESSGNLERVFADLTESLTKQKDLRDKIKGALVYPVILLCLSLLILIFMVMFALPRIARVFMEGGLEPPTFSRVVFSTGLFLNDLGPLLLVIVLGLGVFLIFFYKKVLIFRKFISSVFNSIPVVKGLVAKIALQRFAATLSSLVKAGIPLNRALEITAPAVGHKELEDALLRISRDSLSKGVSLGEAFRKETFFPHSVVNLIAISEKTGRIEEVLDTLSEFYVKEIDSSVKGLVSLLEPMLLLLIGGIIGVIALAIIVPIYQLTTQF